MSGASQASMAGGFAEAMAGLGNEINDWYNGGNALKGTGQKSQTFGSNNYLNNNCI